MLDTLQSLNGKVLSIESMVKDMDSRLKRLESLNVGPSGLQDDSQIYRDDAQNAALCKNDSGE